MVLDSLYQLMMGRIHLQFWKGINCATLYFSDGINSANKINTSRLKLRHIYLYIFTYMYNPLTYPLLIKLNSSKLRKLINTCIELRKETGNVTKRQQPDHRAVNSRRPPMGLQCSEKLPHPEASFSWPLKICILVQW